MLKQGGQAQVCSLKLLALRPWDRASLYSFKLSLQAEKVTCARKGATVSRGPVRVALQVLSFACLSRRVVRVGHGYIGVPDWFNLLRLGYTNAAGRKQHAGARSSHLLAVHRLVCVPAATIVLGALIGDVGDAPRV